MEKSSVAIHIMICSSGNDDEDDIMIREELYIDFILITTYT